jgi:hypothetical protein
VLQFSDQAAASAWILNEVTVPECGSGYQELNIPSQYVSLSDVIAADGGTPSASQTAFALATVVVSRERLLTPNEMAWFNYMAARGEGTAPVEVWEGFAHYTGKPFTLATGGRMILKTKLR